MKLNILLSILVIGLGYVTCKSFQKNKPAEAVPPAVEQAPDPRQSWNASHVIEGNNPDNARPLQIARAPRMVQVPIDGIPPASTSTKAYLATGWWHLNMAMQPSDSTVHINYQNKYLKFREDQTFDILIKNKVVDTGRWNWDESKKEIYLSCKDPYVNNTWAVQDKGFVMIWKGNTALNVTGIQVRVVGTRQEPSSD